MDKLKGLKSYNPRGQDGGRRQKVAGMIGKGKNTTESAQDHQSTPLSALQDPASFGPPPRRVPGQPLPPPSSVRSITSSTSSASAGLGAPLTREEMDAARRKREEAERTATQEQVREPPGPYRADTTGLTTAGLPKPPTFRPGQSQSPPAAPARSTPPSLPPRLPPRTARPVIESPPPPYATAQQITPSDSYINQGAVNRLAQSGISVSAFNIGGTSSPPLPARTHSNSIPTSPANGSQMNELQAHFSKMNTTTSSTQASTGTTWAQKQAALRTASNFKKDPSSVSLSDARTAATTANKFRERHGEEAAAGLKTANSMNQKYGIMNKVQSYGSGAGATSASTQPNSPASPTYGITGKKAAPPPPVKRRELMENAPPIPMGSKPKPLG
ncbi:hypothetical protein EJ08DRAFT_658006 [Tothia fuscella]|uniref:Uncharacterized protein n=1 Tax=Tothia fuscella TaxID=1048955 RepID=A0A9P4NXG9_9PEZI|nr:hypothetical protein EJ08DRAFT_658006 [Tothia fuscella]